MNPRNTFRNALYSCLLSLSPLLVAAQNRYDLGFTRRQDITASAGRDTLPMPWAGGINSVRFSEIDIDLDGHNDLAGFEKHGNRILPFIWQDSHYRYAPEYRIHFPKLHDWAIFKDYNHDGSADIFTYGLAGISVYKNVSQDHLQFEPVDDRLDSYYYNGYINIFSSPDDYLVIEDIDGDDNLDILNFWVLGKYVHYQRNYGQYDSGTPFDFRLEDECWGRFSEAADNNVISLNTNCEDKDGPDDGPTRHTGSSMLLHDFDGDGLADLLLGDVDSPHLILLHNGGTPAEAVMTSQDTCFPAGGQTVDMYSMPAPSLVQLPCQPRPSLLVSPSDPSLAKSVDLNSVWRYDYDTLLHSYTLTDKAFLQKDIIDAGSGCYPVLFDWNGDGLADLFIANYGSCDSTRLINGFVNSSFSSSISYWQNAGTHDKPAFKLTDKDFGHLKRENYQALYPTFGDFDGDGLTDVLCGQKDGTLLMFPHRRFVDANSNDITINYANINVQAYSTPQYFDLDQDGLKDLVIGNRRGLLAYHRNIGTAQNSEFQHVTDTLGQVDVRDYNLSYFGYSVPCLYRDPQRGTLLLCGSEQGKVFEFRGIDGNTDGAFIMADSALAETIGAYAHPIREGKRTAAAMGELNNDTLPDLFVGNYAGGLAFFEGSQPMADHSGLTATAAGQDIRLFPNPTAGLIRVQSPHEIRSMTVYDISGRQIMRKAVHAGQTELDIRHLTNGFYILLIESGNHLSCRKKIIKQ